LPLANLAERYEVAVLITRHLNKGGRGRALYRGSGHIGFQSVCRTSWLVSDDPGVPGQRVLAPVKNNRAAPQPSLAFAFESTDGSSPTLRWLGASPWKADQLVCKTPGPAPLALERAEAFLMDFLKDGPRTCADIWPAGEAQGLSDTTLRRARRELNIRSVPIKVNGKRITYWMFDNHNLPPDIPPDAVPPSLEPWLKPLREKYPPRTPLEEE
jgi:hypothetical protein